MTPTKPRNPHVKTENGLWFCPECCWPLLKMPGVGFFYYYADDTEPQRHDEKWVDCGKPFHPDDARNPYCHPEATTITKKNGKTIPF